MPGNQAHIHEYDSETHRCVDCHEPNPSPPLSVGERLRAGQAIPFSELTQARSDEEVGVYLPDVEAAIRQIKALEAEREWMPEPQVIVVPGIASLAAVGEPGSGNTSTIEWRCRQVTALDSGARRYVFTHNECADEQMQFTTETVPEPDFIVGRVYRFATSMNPVPEEEVTPPEHGHAFPANGMPTGDQCDDQSVPKGGYL